MPTSLQSAPLRVRKLEACREALRQLPNETIAAIQPAVFKPRPSRTPSLSYPGPQPYCRYCRKFGSRAQHCGHNPAMQYTAWDAILGMDFLRADRIVIDFDRQLLVINERPEPIGQSIAALKLDNSWINEMLLGACVDRETNSEVVKILNETRDIFDCNCDFLGRTRILQH
ncbi:hypothetical protein D915_007701 [Fasciola hepatica]|uniref:Uncharacterized protein n=1 Tax=Fasciola hepatica TaxID=6192 RepID=A0A4E0R5P9_FASHE|nr:hypothetical protein D915_007701 [Fasciola hepatica]